MFNPYTIILGLFIAAGVLAMVWGWVIVARGRKTLAWPRTEGVIEVSEPDPHDLLPNIVFSYTVAGQAYRQPLQLSGGITPSQELVASYLKKFPTGARIQVSYDPVRPDHATLEPGPGKGDWIVFAFGLVTTVCGIIFMLFGN